MVEKTTLDAAETPLHAGVHLIEASAGTGKTYAIAMLVLRFIAEQDMNIENILLVTFTRAATEELGERIRLRLVEAKKLLQEDGGAGDATLRRWAASLKAPQLALRRIQIALLDIDRAPVFTIHGFCQRMLQEQALESSQLFDVELQPDLEIVRRSVAQDFWRKNIYSLPHRPCGVIIGHYRTPEQLYATVQPVSERFASIEPQTEGLGPAVDVFETKFQCLSYWWKKNGETLYTALQACIAEGKMKKQFCEDFASWWQRLDGYFSGENSTFFAEIWWLHRHNLAGYINGAKVRGAKKEHLLDSLQLPEFECAALQAAVTTLLLSLRRDFADFLLIETEKRMTADNAMSFDDLVFRLSRALDGSQRGMADLLGRRFHAAVIDEFQDTDALQWRIFHRVFGTGNHFLYLIGDPKQAIYGFRGADIHSYFQARQRADTTLTLQHNHRSHPGIVAALNDLFAGRPRPFFFEEEVLDFSPVEPARVAADGYLEKDGVPLPTLALCSPAPSATAKDGRWSSSAAAEEVMGYVVAEIVDLLNSPVQLGSREGKRDVLPGDIAILVRQNRQAEEYQEALARVNVPAVLSSRQSVFTTEECAYMHLLLKALANPGDINVMKRAMTLPWFGWRGDELYRIFNDEQRFDLHQARFHGYAETWRSRGVLVMMNHLLHGEGILATIGSLDDRAERRIANIHHLAELLQQAESDFLYGPLQLLHWLRRKMDAAGGEEELRLESDEDAVRLVTMHGAKGMEYPVVFCPSLWYRQTRLQREEHCISCHEENGAVLDLGSTYFEERRQRAMAEEMAEEMRLLYVALTRAKLRCYVMWCDVGGRSNGPADSFDSGLGYLLYPHGRVSWEEQHYSLQNLGEKEAVEYILLQDQSVGAAGHTAGYTTGYTTGYTPRYHGGAAAAVELQGNRERRRELSTDRQMTSYSALAASTVKSRNTAIPGDFEEQMDGGEIAFSSLPAGPQFGNVVHDILEKVPFAGLHRAMEYRPLIERICAKYMVTLDTDLLERMLATVVATPLVPSAAGASGAKRSFSLADIATARCLKEMEFYFHLHHSSTGEVNDVLAEEQTVGFLSPRRLEGFLTGFVDLVFEHDGMFYIIDYKTNNLGHGAEAYHQDRLIEEMAVHNYGLQYWLYSLVLHRYLKNFMPEYAYDIHFGGIFYLFVRGMDGVSSRGVFHCKPEAHTLERFGCCFE
ncbi:MAG: exodeoxyribonuclease V subunit beta [Desulfopila sp.]